MDNNIEKENDKVIKNIRIILFVILLLSYFINNLYKNNGVFVLNINENLYNLTISIVFITILGLVFIFLPRKNLNKIKKLNRGVAKKLPVILRLRFMFINIPLIIRGLCIGNCYIDMELRRLLKMNRRAENRIDLIIRIVHGNIMYWILLPIKLFYQIYVNLLTFIFHTSKLDVISYIKARVVFLLISIICFMLLGIRFIKIIIIVGILETIITSYGKMYFHVIEIVKDNNKAVNERIGEHDVGLTFTGFVIAIRTASDKLEVDYHVIVLDTLYIELHFRRGSILLYEGFEDKEIINILYDDNSFLGKIKRKEVIAFNEYSKCYGMLRAIDLYYTSGHPYDYLLSYISVNMPRRTGQPEKVEDLLTELKCMKKYKRYNKTEKLIREKFQAFIEEPVLGIEFIFLDKKYNFSLGQGFGFYQQPDIRSFLKKLEKYGEKYLIIDEKTGEIELKEPGGKE